MGAGAGVEGDKDKVRERGKKKRKKERGGETVKIIGTKKENSKGNRKKEMREGIIGILPFYPCDTVRRNCFAKRFFKTDSASPANLLHQHSHS
jgi:hypothetical protein